MLDTEPDNTNDNTNGNRYSSADSSPGAGAPAGSSGSAGVRTGSPPPQVIFQPPAVPEPRTGGPEGHGADAEGDGPGQQTGRANGSARDADPGDDDGGRRRRRRGGRGRGRQRDGEETGEPGEAADADGSAGTGGGGSSPDGSGGQAAAAQAAATGTAPEAATKSAGRKGGSAGARRAEKAAAGEAGPDGAGDSGAGDEGDDDQSGDQASTRRRRRRRRRGGNGDAETADAVGPAADPGDPPNTVIHVREPRATAIRDEVQSVKGSTRLQAKKQRRREGAGTGRRRPPVISESEFLARREAVQRLMVIRQQGERTQIAVLEDGVLAEHYVDRTSHQSYVGNVYLGRVQNVLPSMEAAFVDIGKGRNAVLYAGEVNFDASGLEGQPKRIEMALKAGQPVLVQATKDPVGHKGARLTNQVSLPGRYLVYVPGASMTGISRKLPDTERTRLKQILKKVMPENAGVIVRTAAEGATEEELARDVARLAAQWEDIRRKAESASPPALLYNEPDLTIRVVRDIFNEDFHELVVAGEDGWDTVDQYVGYVAPHLAGRLKRWQDEDDVFASYRIDEQLGKALERKVWLPSGGSLVIDRTEAMTVIDVNTGKFTGQGGNLEETVTRNNLEAAEEIVRQLRLRDVGGIIVIDFIDMVLESNRELVLRRLLECLARDRTKHQVAEVTSLGLVQMTRKRVGSGLLESFSEPCECCNGRGLIVSLEPVDPSHPGRRGAGRGAAHAGSANSSAGRTATTNGTADGTADEEQPDAGRRAGEEAPSSSGSRRRRRKTPRTETVQADGESPSASGTADAVAAGSVDGGDGSAVGVAALAGSGTDGGADADDAAVAGSGLPDAVLPATAPDAGGPAGRGDYPDGSAGSSGDSAGSAEGPTSSPGAHAGILPADSGVAGPGVVGPGVAGPGVAPEGGAADSGAAAPGAAEPRAAESGAVGLGVAEPRAAESGAAYSGAAEGGTAESGAAEGGTAEGGAAEGGAAEPGPAQPGAAETGFDVW